VALALLKTEKTKMRVAESMTDGFMKVGLTWELGYLFILKKSNA
jgi:hypothetical protein